MSRYKIPTMRSISLPILLLGLSALAFVLYALYFDGPYSVYDDSFISFRYSRNLARGEGLVFNPHDPTEGYTNFLWTFLLGGAMALNLDIIITSKILALLAGLATLWLVYRLLVEETQQPWAGVLAALMLALTVSFARYAVSGFEMLLYGFLIFLGLYLYLRALRTRTIPIAAAVALALAAMTRPEGVLVYGVVSLHYVVMLGWVIKPGRRWFIYLAGWLVSFGIIYGLYFIWRYTYYDYLLPNTFYAKVGQPSQTLMARGWSYLGLILLTNPQLGLCLLLGFFWPANRRVAQSLLAGLSLIYLGYIVAVGGDSLLDFGPRFMVPLWPVIYSLGAGGVAGLSARLAQRYRPILWASLGVLLTAIFIVLAGPERQAYLAVQQTRNLGWITLGQWLAGQAQPGDTLAIDAAGIIPFYTDLYTIDMLGLNDRHIAHLDITTGKGLAGHDKFDPRYVLAQKPTYISVWLNPQGKAEAWGLDAVADQLETDYRLRAVVLMAAPSADRPVLLVDPVFTPALHEQGYLYGLFRRVEQ